MIFTVFFWLLILYFLWEKILKTYYKYWYYTSQGVKAGKFPLPLLGNALQIKKLMNETNEFSE